jgi:hypothetical protein
MCHRPTLNAPSHPPAQQAAQPRLTDERLLDAAHAFDRAVLWPTRRIRIYLRLKRSAAATQR